MIKLKRILTVFFVITLLSSCKIGNFMDIGNGYNDSRLFLYVQTTNEIRIYEIDQEEGTLSEIGSPLSLTSEINNCNLVYESEKHNLFISHGINPTYSLSGYSINDDGSLSLLSGYPRTDFGVDPVDDFLFEDNKSFLYAAAGGNIYGFVYESDGSLNPTAPATWGGVNTPLEGRGIEMFHGYLMKQDNADSNMMYTIDGGTGVITFISSPAPNINSSSPGALTVSNGYVFKLEGAVPNNAYSYSIDVPGVTTNQLSSQSFGSVSLSSNNAIVKDPESMFLYFVSDTEDIIFCLRTNTDGTIGAIIDQVATGNAPDAAAIDPHRQYFFTAGTDGGIGWQLNIHKMDGDLPSGSYNHISVADQVLEIIAIRSGDN